MSRKKRERRSGRGSGCGERKGSWKRRKVEVRTGWRVCRVRGESSAERARGILGKWDLIGERERLG